MVGQRVTIETKLSESYVKKLDVELLSFDASRQCATFAMVHPGVFWEPQWTAGGETRPLERLPDRRIRFHIEVGRGDNFAMCADSVEEHSIKINSAKRPIRFVDGGVIVTVSEQGPPLRPFQPADE
jgi:hypothetical protein